MDEDGRLRTVYTSICPCGQWTEICSQTVHLMDEFGRPLKISKYGRRWTGGQMDESSSAEAWYEQNVVCFVPIQKTYGISVYCIELFFHSKLPDIGHTHKLHLSFGRLEFEFCALHHT